MEITIQPLPLRATTCLLQQTNAAAAPSSACDSHNNANMKLTQYGSDDTTII
jgi:hypothetical protein